MKIEIDQEVLSKALSYLSRIVSTRPSYPVLSNLLLDANKNGTVSFSATNLDITLTVRSGAEVKTEGKITCPAKTLSDFVSFLSSGTVTLATDRDKLTVSSGSHKAVFATIPTEEFPELPEVTKSSTTVLVISGKVFKEIVEKVAFACSKDLSRPIFSAVLFEPAAEQVVWVGLDGHRLSKVISDIKIEGKADPLLLPADALEEVSRSISEDEDLTIYSVKKGQHVVMKFGTIDLACRQVEGVYPDYKVALPKEEKSKLTLPTEEFLNAVKMARLFSSDELANRIEMEFAKDKLTISSSGSKAGESTTVLDVEGEGEDFKAAFNAQFLSDMLSRVETEKTEFSTFVPATDEKLRGGVIREEGNPDFFHIVMPLFTS